MSTVPLLANFDRLAEAPGAVPRLRRFILDLAVRGKLVEQDAGDESAFKAGRRHDTQAVGPNLNVLKQPLPARWAWMTIDQIADVSSGTTPSRDVTEYYSQNGTPWVTSGETSNAYIRKTAQHVSDRALKETSLKLYPPGTLIVAMYGEGKTRGQVAELSIAATTNQACAALVLKLDDVGHRRYVKLFFQKIYEEIRALASGGAQPNLNGGKIKSTLIPLPPLAEQHRIVAKVDELMALCDQLEAAQQERERRRDRLASASLQRLNQPTEVNPATDQTEPAEARQQAQREQQKDYARFHLQNLNRLTTRPEHIKAMRQTILNLAVRGCLLPQDTNNEPAIDLIERIRAEKLRLIKVGTLKKANLVAQIPDEEIQFALPSGWLWVRLGDLLLGDSQNGYSKRPDDAVDGVPILRISAGTVRQDGIVAEEQYKLIGGITPAHRRQYEVRPGDLLACRFNGNRHFVGRISLYTGYLGNSPIYPDKLIRLRLLHEFVLPKLVRHFAESEPVRKDIEGYCATTVGNRGISASNMKDVKIPLPPLAEQHRIVAKVDELMALCDQLEAQLTQSQTDSRRLLEAVLEAAIA